MKTEKVPVEIDGQKQYVTIGERSGRSWADVQRLALKGATVSSDGKAQNIKGESSVEVMMKQIQDAIKEYPEGITDFMKLLDKITESELKTIYEVTKKLNDTGEIEKKSKGQ